MKLDTGEFFRRVAEDCWRERRDENVTALIRECEEAALDLEQFTGAPLSGEGIVYHHSLNSAYKSIVFVKDRTGPMRGYSREQNELVQALHDACKRALVALNPDHKSGKYTS